MPDMAAYHYLFFRAPGPSKGPAHSEAVVADASVFLGPVVEAPGGLDHAHAGIYPRHERSAWVSHAPTHAGYSSCLARGNETQTGSFSQMLLAAAVLGLGL